MNETTKTAPSIMDILVDALVERIKDKLIEAVDARIADNRAAIDPDEIEGLERWFKDAIDEHERSRVISADEIDRLEETIEKCSRMETSRCRLTTSRISMMPSRTS